MKVMIVTPYFYPKVGGLENYALNIALGLKKQGHIVFVVTSNHTSKNRIEEKVKGLRVIRLPRAFKLSNTPINPLWRWQLRAIIKSEKPNVINAHTPVPYIADMAARAAGQTPFVLTYHNDLAKPSFVGNFLAKTFYILLSRRTMRRSARIIATSEYYASASPYLQKYMDKVSIVSPGVDLDRFNPQVDKKWLKKKYPGKKIVLFVGSMDKTHSHKGVDVLIKAVAKAKKSIPNIQLVAVGSGDAISEYKQLAKKLKTADIVGFPGFIPDKELPKYYAGADVFVLPSTNESEGFGMVLAEAQACGTPVIGTKVGGIPFVVKDKFSGLLVRPNSDRDLSNAIKKILTDKLLRKKLSALGDQSVINNFDWFAQTRTLHNQITNLISPKVIQVSAYYPPHLGGQEIAVQDLATNLVSAAEHVEVVTSDQGTLKGTSIESGVKVTRLRSSEFAHTAFIWGLLPWLLKHTRKDTIVHLHMGQVFTPEIVWLASKIKRYKYIVHMHTEPVQSGAVGKILPLYKKLFLKRSVRAASAVVVLNKEHGSILRKEYGYSGKLLIMSNGIDEKFFRIKRKTGKSDTLKLLFVGRFAPGKNLISLLEAISNIKHKVSLDLVGDGECRDEIEQFIRSKGLKNVTLHGKLGRDEVREFYSKCDAFTLTSHYEAQPLVLLEAMAARVPVIGTNVRGVAEHIKDVGILTEPNSNEITKAIEKFASSSEKQISKMTSRGFRKVQDLKWEKLITTYLELYRKNI
jgi:glycosyltransferase involved in cell wall biosynthesis